MQIHDLTQQTPTTNSQLIFDTGSATYKALVSDIAKCIIEQYAGSTIGGAAQTLVAAIDQMQNNKLDLYKGTKIESNTDLNTLTTPGTYFCVNTATAATLVNSPLTSVGFRLDVSRNGYNTNNYLVQTMQAVVTSTVVTYKRGMSVQNTWGAWYQTNEAPRQFSRTTSLSDIPLGSNGYVQLDASVSPTGETTSFMYWCTGVPTRRSIIVVYAISSETKAYVNALHNDDGVTWKGWKSITLS